MPQSRLFDGNNNELKTSGTSARTAAWAAAGWIYLDESVGRDATQNIVVCAKRGTSPYHYTGLRVTKVGGRWVPGAYHDHASTDSYRNATNLPISTFKGWLFVAGSHVTDGVPPRIYVGTPDSPIVEGSLISGQYVNGAGASDTAAALWQIGQYGPSSMTIRAALAWVAWWSAELTPGELDTYRQMTAAGSWPNVRRDQLWGLWPLDERMGTASARDLGSNALTLSSANATTGDIGPALEEPAADLSWWWRDVHIPAGSSPQTLYVSSIASGEAVGTPAVTAGAVTVSPTGIGSGEAFGSPTVQVGAATVSPTGIGSGETHGSPTVTTGAVTVSPTGIGSGEAFGPPAVSLDTGRTLDGTNDGFQCLSATAITTSTWSWCGHVKLDAVTGTHYVWYTETSTPTRIQSISVETVGGKYRLRAYQILANYTYHQATWDLPIPTGTDCTIGVQFNNSARTFRAYVGTDTIPMMELQWRSEMAQGTAGQAPYSAMANSRWHISPSGGRVDGMVANVAVTNDTLTVAEMDVMRRYGSPPTDSNLLGWWLFGEASGNASDGSGNSRTMSTVGSPGVTSRTTAAASESSNTLTLTSVADWQLFQRSGGSASVPLVGTYGGSPSAIEARFTPLGSAPGSWTTVVASPSGGTFSASLTVSTGQGTLEVRANHGGTYAYVRRGYVAVGDLYWSVGTSNSVGQGTNFQTLDTTMTRRFGDLHPAQLSNWDVSGTHQWIAAGDPTDTPAGSIYFGPNVSWSQNGADPTKDTWYGGSWLLLLAGRLAEAHGVPVAIGPCGKFASTLANWRKSAGTMYAELRSRCEQVAGASVPLSASTAGRAILCVQGENEYAQSTSATFGTDVAAWADEMTADFGMDAVLMNVGDWPGSEAYQQASNPADGITKVRVGVMSAVTAGSAKLGPTMYDVDLSAGDTHHYKTDSELGTVSDRWYAALSELYYSGGSVGRGPRVQSVTRNGLAVTVKFDVSLDAAGGGFDGVSVYDGTPAAGTRLTWVSSAPTSGQYTAVRDGSDTSQMTVTLGAAPSGTVYVGVGEWDLSAGKTVPTVTRSIASVSVTLPAEVFSQVAAIVAKDVSPTAIGSAEAVGSPTVSVGAVTVSPTAISSGEAWGTATVTRGAVTVSPTAISSGETWGTPAVAAGQILSPPSISSGEAWGTATVSVGAVTVIPAGIPSGEAWGTPAVAAGQILSPPSISSGESWGTLSVTITGTQTLSPPAIPSAETWGVLAVTGGASVYRDLNLSDRQRRPRSKWRGAPR